MSDVVTHKAKTGPLLTGTEYEAADAHDPHDHGRPLISVGAVGPTRWRRPP